MFKEYLTSAQQNIINNGQDLDFTIGIKGLSRFRINIYQQRGNIAASLRSLPSSPPDINTLGLPYVITNLTNKKKGLILITGGTGSGKSTTLAALVQKISNELKGHIITIEDPIEFLFSHSSICLIVFIRLSSFCPVI